MEKQDSLLRFLGQFGAVLNVANRHLQGCKPGPFAPKSPGLLLFRIAHDTLPLPYPPTLQPITFAHQNSHKITEKRFSDLRAENKEGYCKKLSVSFLRFFPTFLYLCTINNHLKMNKTRLWITAAILTCGFHSTTAQVVRGTVTDAISGEPLIGATVKIAEKDGKAAVTDIDGHYRIDVGQAGRYTVETSYVGYEPSVMKEQLIVGAKENIIDIALRENSQELTEVVVRPRVNKEATVNPTALVGGVMLSMEEANRFAGGFNDPARLVTAFAGVAGSNNGNGVSVHGNAPQMMKYRIEGVEVFTPNHYNDFYEAGFGMVSALNANVIGNSDFFTSTFNANYSNSLSGVFDVKMRAGNNAKHESILQVGTVNEELTLEGPLSKKNNSSYILNYRYGFTQLADKLKIIDYDTDYNFQDFSLKLNFPTRKAGTFSLFALGYYDGAEDKYLDIDDIESIYDASRQKGHVWGLLGGASHKIHFGSKWTWRTTLAYNAQHVKADIGYWSLRRGADNVLTTPIAYEEPQRVLPYSSQKMNEDRILLNTELSKQVTARWLTQFGAEYSHRFFNLGYSATDFVYSTAPFTEYVRSKGNTGLGSLFWQNVIKPSQRFSLNLGVAASYFLFSKDLSVEPRVSAKWDMDDRNTLSFGYGLHSMVERMDAYFYEENGKQVNKDLGLSKAHHLLLTYLHKFSDNLNLRVNAYYQYGFDTPVGTNGSTFCATNRFMNYFDEPLVPEGNTRNYGADVTLEHYMHHGFFGQVNASVFKSEYRGQDKVWRSQLYDRGYTAKVLGGKEWMVGARRQNVLNVSVKYTVQGGLRYTPVDVAAMTALMDAGQMPEDVIYKQDEAMSKQYDPEHNVDLTVSYKWNKRKVSHTIAFEGINILMSETPYTQRFDLRTRTVTIEKIGISLPNLFYRLDF